METVDGLAELHMSGTRAVFRLDAGSRVDKEALAEAFAERGLTLDRVARTETPAPESVYLVDAGIT